MTVLIGDEDDAVVFDWDPTLPTGQAATSRPARHRRAAANW